MLVDGYLRVAKSNKTNYCVVMLDLIKAFGIMKNSYIKHTLELFPISSSLHALVTTLKVTNSTKFNVNHKPSKSIAMNCGIP